MFDALKQLISDVISQPETQGNLHGVDSKLAEAALLFHVIAVDGIVENDEKRRLQSILSNRFGLDETQTSSLISQAQMADEQAIDLYKFTSVLMRSMDYDERRSIIANMWEMVYADGAVHEMEDNVVWRVAELLGIDNRERILLKQQVRDALAASTG